MNVAVCLLTCNRPELTELAVESFRKHNKDLSRYWLLHCDCGSTTRENVWIAQNGGFHTLLDPTERIGQMETLREFLKWAVNTPWVLWLENDWESVAPLLSQGLLQAAFDDDVQTIRLFGVNKFRDCPAGPSRIVTKTPIDWTYYTYGLEVGHAHWGGGGTLVRTSYLLQHQNLASLKDIIKADEELKSLRPTENIMFCIGDKRTDGLLV